MILKSAMGRKLTYHAVNPNHLRRAEPDRRQRQHGVIEGDRLGMLLRPGWSAFTGVRIMSLLDEAQKCRFDALALADRPEGPLLIQIADAFEKLAELNNQLPEAPGGLPSSLRIEGSSRRIFFRDE